MFLDAAKLSVERKVMGRRILHPKVKLIVGFIYSDVGVFDRARALIIRTIGCLDLESDEFNFCHTDYYKSEFGGNLKRKFASVKRLLIPENAYRAKLTSNKIENRLSKAGRRLINIDPGYITESKLILLTTKDYSHRVYLREGIYGEVTLKFQDGAFCPLDTTYPDYKSENYINFFNNVRALYREAVR